MRWKNVPIPETIVIPIVVGVLAEVFFPLQFLRPTTLSLLFTLIFLGGGILLMIWSVVTAGNLDVSTPDTLLTKGPYAFSRNPMYVSWLIVNLSALSFTRSVWLLFCFAAAFLLTHYLAILPEERYLREKFEDSFVRYCEKVRRYI